MIALALAVASLVACSSDNSAKKTSGVTPPAEGDKWQTLDEWHLFRNAVQQEPNDRVIPYDVNSVLFSNYAAKDRFLYVPEGAHIGYSPTEKWDLPVGTVLVKTFAYLNDPNDASKGQHLLETRLLVHESTGWNPMTYIWDDAQKTATLAKVGGGIPAHFTDPLGETYDINYIYPSRSECRSCHGLNDTTNTLGGRTRQLNRDHDYGKGPENQIDHLASLGLFSSPPEPAATREHLVDYLDKTQPVFERVRSYFESNCSHCHQQAAVAVASTSGLFLDYQNTAQIGLHQGICKQPQSAGTGTCGYSVDVFPGNPDASIIMCRLLATQGIAMMPPIGRVVVHKEGVELIREWIASIPGSCGPGGPTADGGVPPSDGSTPSDSGGPG